jgi:hypothetical protein
MKAVAFSQRIPPVQNMAMGFVLSSMPAVSTQSGNCRKVLVSGLIAPLKVPMPTS